MDPDKVKNSDLIVDDQRERLGLLFRQRVPWLLLGLLGGVITSVVVSGFEKVLSEHIALAFFLPLIVYMSDAVGTQTEAIYVRNLAREKVKFWVYLIKEIYLGLLFALLFGVLLSVFAYFWLHDKEVAITVGLAMGVNVIAAPVVALLISVFLHKEHQDPAVGAGPSTTVIQDFISILIYFLIASLILFK